MAGGTYSSPTFTPDASKESAFANVVFRPAAGAKVVVSGTMWFDAAHITVKGFHFVGWGSPSTNPSAFAMRFDGAGCHTHNIVISNSTSVNSPAFQVLNGSHDIRFTRDDFGSYGTPGVGLQDADIAGTWTETCNGAQAPNAYNILLDHSKIHDVYWNVPESQWGGAHPDCLELDGRTGDPTNPKRIAVTIWDNVFYHCGNSFLMLGANDFRSHGMDCCSSYGVLVEDNVFWGLGNDSYYGIQIIDHTPYVCGGYTFTRNTYVPDNPNALGPYSPVRFECSGGRVSVTHNLFEPGLSAWFCRSWSPYSDWSQNLFVSRGRCGADSVTVPFGYTFEGTGLRPVAPLVKTIRRAFDLAGSGVPLGKIPAALRKAKLVSSNRFLHVKALRRILTDPVYVGGFYGAPRSNPGVVTRALWKRVQQALA